MSAPNVRNQHAIHLPAPADIAFQFFTPKGEEAWIDHWRPHYLHPADGHTVEGMVFTTDEGAEITLWQLVVFDPLRRRSVYARTTPALRVGTVTVHVDPIDGDSCLVNVRYDMTAVAGNDAALDGYRDPRFTAMIEEWGVSIRALLPDLIEKFEQ